MVTLPKQLLAIAYKSEKELAWNKQGALQAIAWATENKIPILGGEVWLATTPGPTIPSAYVYTFETRQNSKEIENEFLRRANEAARKYVETFSWDSRDSTCRDKEPYFNFTFAKDFSF